MCYACFVLRLFCVCCACCQVTKDGIAESLGMRIGDIVVRVNDIATSNLKHSAAQEVILGCGNSFVMAILRPDDEAGNDFCSASVAISEEFEKISAECSGSPCQQQTPDSLTFSDMSEVTIETVPSSTRSNSREDTVLGELKQRHKLQQQLQQLRAKGIDELATDVTDDHIAELLSGEAEVLKEHNVIG